MAPGDGIVAFYSNTGGDQRGRTLSQILSFSNDQLEYTHDYIQTLFPMPEASVAQALQGVDIITEDVFRAFRARQDLRSNLKRAFKRMLEFWGFSLQDQVPGLRIKVCDEWRIG
jgi:hypothetical protein